MVYKYKPFDSPHTSQCKPIALLIFERNSQSNQIFGSPVADLHTTTSLACKINVSDSLEKYKITEVLD